MKTLRENGRSRWSGERNDRPGRWPRTKRPNERITIMNRFRSNLLRSVGIAALVLASASERYRRPGRGPVHRFPRRSAGRPAVEALRQRGRTPGSAGGSRLALDHPCRPDAQRTGRISSPARHVRGDFDISCAYEVIQIDRPTSGWGAGLEFFVMTDTPTNEAFDMMRTMRADAAPTWSIAAGIPR